MNTTTSANMMVNDPQSSSIARGSRLEVLRRMARLTRREFAEKHGISANTIQSWETGKSGGLTIRGAQRIIPAFHQEGIFCTLDWLMHGVGQPPRLTNLQFSGMHEAEARPLYPPPDTDAITRELLTFRNVNSNTADLIVNDDGMEPRYQQGDYVAGIRRTGDTIRYLVNQDCIVQTKNNEVLLRRIKSNSQSNLYDLLCINLKSQVPLSTVYAQALIWAAPIIWHRRHDILEMMDNPD
jgi:transcriptional regulator with XRE-family HTH domain